ncbi:MAG TPA: hypothetical protein VFV50_00870 [Bdellovibrionales bacterium]|nr:hypothetical protein [Bdellovibrionales bacterium]
MENYRTPPRPLAQRFLGSSIFYGILALILVGAAIHMVMRAANREADTPPPPTYALDQRPIATIQPEAFGATPVPAADTTEVAGEKPLAGGTQPLGTPVPTQVPTAAAAAATTRALEAASSSATKRKNSLKITWTEVNRDFYGELLGERLPTGQFRVGILMEELNGRSLKARMEFGRNEKMIRNLDSSSHTLTLSETDRRIEILQSSHDPKVNEKVGVILNLEPVSIDEAGLQLRFEIRRATPQLQARGYTVDTFNATDELLIPPRGAAFLSGFIPHREPYDEIEQRLFSANPVLKVLNSKTFQTGLSEIIVFFEPVLAE